MLTWFKVGQNYMEKNAKLSTPNYTNFNVANKRCNQPYFFKFSFSFNGDIRFSLDPLSESILYVHYIAGVFLDTRPSHPCVLFKHVISDLVPLLLL